MEHNKGSPEREVHSIIGVLKGDRNIQTNNLSPRTRIIITKRKPRVSRRKEIIKIRAELNDIETKKTKGSMNPEAGSLKR